MDHSRVEQEREQGLDAFTGGWLDEYAQINVSRGPWLDAILMPLHGFSTYLSGLIGSVQESLD
ncbi:MAG TPA: hypothetical protein VES92_03030 [Nitrospiraceae bacterium]|nr:hypothetical protein [Nitrospiraceae bacterium]